MCVRACVHARVSVCVHMGVPIQEPVEAEGISSPEAGVTGDSEILMQVLPPVHYFATRSYRISQAV